MRGSHCTHVNHRRSAAHLPQEEQELYDEFKYGYANYSALTRAWLDLPTRETQLNHVVTVMLFSVLILYLFLLTRSRVRPRTSDARGVPLSDSTQKQAQTGTSVREGQ